VLIDRFSETRRRHPLGGKLLSAIQKEQKILQKIKKISDVVIDTSNLSLPELKNKVLEVLEKKLYGKLSINVLSFGYKFGLPLNADIIFDTRFLPNPNYIYKLKKLTGKNKKVQQYLLNSTLTQKFLSFLKNLISFLIPQVIREGKNYFTIGFGCTGGQHRSVALAEMVYKFLVNFKRKNKYNYKVFVSHRDI
jgi:UPF0042 nucleotide-binding protein